MSTGLERLSLNQKTTNSWSLPEAVNGCVRAGLHSIGVWREPLADIGLGRAKALIDAAGLRVSSLCRGGFLTAADDVAFEAALAENTRAIEEAATLEADCLVMVVGGLPDGSRNLPAARARVSEGIERLVPVAAKRGVRLALEPMHPIFTADRGVLATLGEALDIAEPYPAEHVGVVVDSFHVWWDPQLEEQVARAGRANRIASFQVCDWITPLPADSLLSRGMMGDGHIDFRYHHELVTAAGYTGDIEVEIFNADIWAADPAAVLETMKRRYLDLVVA
ncbi:sugar phosphate isomerase/epimerase family protein [Humibacillus xanthopallidus]|uniref:Sugar phosphate isomerase/epimerase n=1 Tax=Humibacillus xanthopallidus TaxID=412689 RepID=A0A543HZJ8_9MICO|nr:sugar phosphate isomerase/epimerase family protein [Humibacillus xanthopallidus]TQM63771.1 sugar phosphate isomerase/epimerase [Humibacillus xanthopallidus]